MEVGEDGRHLENMATFKAGDIVKLKTCKQVASKDDLWEITALDGPACSIVNLADRLRAEEQGRKIAAQQFDTSLLSKVL
jgi:hypothetical protein